MSSNIFIIHSCCIPVKGHRRSIIYDINRNQYFYITNDLYDILVSFNGTSKKMVYKNFDSINYSLLDDYFKFLEENEIIFYTKKNNEKLFPRLKIEWESPSIITNAIIDITQEIESDNFILVLSQLESLQCEAIQIREVGNGISSVHLKRLLDTLSKSTITYIELFLHYRHQEDIEELSRIANIHNRIFNIYIYNSPKYSIESFESRPYGNVLYIKDNLKNSGKIHDESMFFVNILLFNESHFNNNYYNRKIYIDEKGNIRNSPEVDVLFGNIKQTLILDVVKDKKFNYLWDIKKDDIIICCNCEYRYMCVDSRIPIKDELKNIWFCENKCKYDPYICQWSK